MRDQRWLVLLLILFIILTRLLVFNKDAANFFPDEWRYRILISKLDEAVVKNDYMIPVQAIFHLDGRPGLGLFYYPAAYLEWKNPTVPIGAYYNIIINSLIIMLIYLTILRIYGKKVAILATLLVTLSNASLIYIRHLLPYDIALFLLLLGLYIFVYFQKSFVFGLFAGMSFLTYNTYYYYLLPIPLVLSLYYRSIKRALLFVIGVGMILLFTNGFSKAIGETTSYFQSLKNESKNVTNYQQGDNITAFSFIGQYIYTIDGFWNLFLILIAFISIFFLKREKRITTIVIYLILTFLIMEIFSHILKTHVLYGRTVRVFYLLLLIFAAVNLDKILIKISKGYKKNYILIFSLIISITFLNWLPRFIIFKDLTFPTQFKQKARDYLNSRYSSKYEIKDALFVNFTDTKSPVSNFFKPGEPGIFYTLNANQIFPYYGNYNLDIFCKGEVLLKEPHIQYIFRPYLFEGYKKVMREMMQRDPLYYQLIYCK